MRSKMYAHIRAHRAHLFVADKAGLACVCVCVFWTLQGIAAVEKFKYFGIFIFEPPF
jgi:hypothetical protein